MKIKFWSSIIFAICILSACTKGKDFKSDLELITAIQQAKKENVEDNALPSNASESIDNDFEESYIQLAQRAEGLGYKVDLRKGEGSRIGEHADVYFDLGGRKLNRKGKKKGCKNDWHKKDCFDLAFPITFIMPDGSTITGTDKRETKIAIKKWYRSNRTVKDKPTLQYPITLNFEDGSTLVVNDETELEQAKNSCLD